MIKSDQQTQTWVYQREGTWNLQKLQLAAPTQAHPQITLTMKLPRGDT